MWLGGEQNGTGPKADYVLIITADTVLNAALDLREVGVEPGRAVVGLTLPDQEAASPSLGPRIPGNQPLDMEGATMPTANLTVPQVHAGPAPTHFRHVACLLLIFNAEKSA